MTYDDEVRKLVTNGLRNASDPIDGGLAASPYRTGLYGGHDYEALAPWAIDAIPDGTLKIDGRFVRVRATFWDEDSGPYSEPVYRVVDESAIDTVSAPE